VDIEEVGFDRPCAKDVHGSLGTLDMHLILVRSDSVWSPNTVNTFPSPPLPRVSLLVMYLVSLTCFVVRFPLKMTGVPHTEWPAKGDVTPLHGLIVSTIKESKNDLAPVGTVACDMASLDPESMDVLVCHKWGNREPIFLRGITETTLNKLVPFLQDLESAGEDSIDSGSAFVAPIAPFQLRNTSYEHFIFCCAHVKRDMRCGYCGSKLADLIEEEIAKRGLKEKVMAARVSHVGGHAYAGNVLAYPIGTWYGYMRPADVPRLFDEHISSGKILADKLRGKVGLNKTENAELAKSLFT